MQPTQHNDCKPAEVVLAASLELASASWKITLHDGKRDKPAIYTVGETTPAPRLEHAVAVIEAVRQKWSVPEHAPVAVICEAGQDGFWISRALFARGHQVLVVDPASIRVERHARLVKTDRLDAIRSVMCLRAWVRGERGKMRVVQVPSLEAEAQRQLVRDRGELQKEVVQHDDRIRKLLRTVGCWEQIDSKSFSCLEQGLVRCAEGSALPVLVQAWLERNVSGWHWWKSSSMSLKAL
jgi:transposase